MFRYDRQSGKYLDESGYGEDGYFVRANPFSQNKQKSANNTQSTGGNAAAGGGGLILLGILGFIIYKIIGFLENNWVSVVIIAGIVLACIITCLIVKAKIIRSSLVIFLSIAVSIGLIIGVISLGIAQNDGNFKRWKRYASSEIVYWIGDTGPAGGIIFYDKKNNKDGWRYLEAAPEDAEFKAIWSENRNTRVYRLKGEIGHGKLNTRLIVETLNKANEKNRAAQVCDDLVFGGFDDWYLPNLAELDQMHFYLKRQNLGELKNGWYWSSTCSYLDGSFWKNFENGENARGIASEIGYVRPIRQLPGPED